MYLDLIHRYKNQKSFELRRRTIHMLISSDAFTLFLLLVEYRYSYQISCGPSDPSVDYCLIGLAYSKTLEFSPWYELALLSLILYFHLGTLILKMYPLLLMFFHICSLTILMGGIYTSIICVNPGTSTGHTLLVLRQISFQQDNFIEIEKWIERYCIEEVGVDPEPLCSCPWIQCRTYHESSL